MLFSLFALFMDSKIKKYFNWLLKQTLICNLFHSKRICLLFSRQERY